MLEADGACPSLPSDEMLSGDGSKASLVLLMADVALPGSQDLGGGNGENSKNARRQETQDTRSFYQPPNVDRSAGMFSPYGRAMPHECGDCGASFATQQAARRHQTQRPVVKLVRAGAAPEVTRLVRGVPRAPQALHRRRRHRTGSARRHASSTTSCSSSRSSRKSSGIARGQLQQRQQPEEPEEDGQDLGVGDGAQPGSHALGSPPPLPSLSRLQALNPAPPPQQERQHGVGV